MMRVICGAIMVVGSVMGMLLSFFSNITTNSDVAILNGLHLSLGMGVFFILTCLGGIYIVANSN